MTVPLATYSEPTTVYRIVESPPVYQSPPPAATLPPSGLPPGCGHTREFQTQIVIDGRTVPAYGTACQMPDGTWRQLGINLR